jgi:outer membrane protein OmpA-like peptidoglycan-associated protein
MIERPAKFAFNPRNSVLLAGLCLYLAGCSSVVPNTLNPVEWYRQATGASKNDETGDERDAKNLGEGSKEPYPNVASVPNPPDVAMSKIERDKLARDLIADRQNAKYTDEQLRAGQNLAALPPPPPMSEARTGGVEAAAAPAAVEPGAPPRPAQPISAIPPRTASGPSAPAAGAPSAAPNRGVARAAPGTRRSTKPSPAIQRAAIAPYAPSLKAQPAKGSEPPPQESTLTPPTLPDMPRGDQPRPVPTPVGTLVPGGAVANDLKLGSSPAATSPSPPAATPSGTTTTPSPPAAAPGPASEASPPVQAPREVASSRGQAVEIGFASNSQGAAIRPQDRAKLDGVAKLEQERGSRVRIVGYDGAKSGTDVAKPPNIDSALDHAKTIAVALKAMGVPSDRIAVESASAKSADRAEIFVEP